MRWKISAGLVLATALLVPAAPAMAQTASPAASCTTINYADVRALITIDLDTATDRQVRVQTGQILTVANAETLTNLPARLQQELAATPDELRTFLKTQLPNVWATDLRIAVGQTMTGAGTNVKAAAQSTLDTATIDAYLAYLNHGRYLARAQDCV